MNTRELFAAIAAVSAATLSAALQPPAPGPATPPARQDPAAPPPKPAPEQTKPPTPAPASEPTPRRQPLPSLDEALGIAQPSEATKPPQPTPGTTPSVPPLPGDLDRALSGEAPGNELQRAVALMERSANRLESAGDTSIDTQRVQEETVRLLEALLKRSGQKQSQQQSSSQQKPQDQSEQQQQPNQSQQSQSEQRQQTGSDPSNDSERGGTRDAQLRPAIDAARAAWGNLPQRVRQLLMQGSGDSFSKEYQRLTEEYYKRLGEGSN